jgi:hypothetical protein
MELLGIRILVLLYSPDCHYREWDCFFNGGKITSKGQICYFFNKDLTIKFQIGKEDINIS